MKFIRSPHLLTENIVIARINRAKSNDKGFTLIELLVVIIIIGILAAIAIPAFLNQRTKGYDAAAKSDIKNASTAMETFYTDAFAYPGTYAELTSAGFNKSSGISYLVYRNNGSNAGYVIYAKHDQSGQAWVASSYNGGAPAKAGNALPGGAPAAGTLGIPTGVTLTPLATP